MLKRIKKLQQPLCAALLDKPREVRPLLPEGEEWTIIEELLDVHVLEPFHKATKTISASSYSTLNMLNPLLYQLTVLVLVSLEMILSLLSSLNKQFYLTYRIITLKMFNPC